MIAVSETVRTVLLSFTAITDLVGTRVHNGYLPNDYDYGARPQAIVFTNDGGDDDNSGPTIQQEFEIVSVGASQVAANAVARAIHDSIHGIENEIQGGVLVKSAVNMTGFSESVDKDVEDLFMALSVYEVRFRNG